MFEVETKVRINESAKGLYKVHIGKEGVIMRKLNLHKRNTPLFIVKLKDIKNYVVLRSNEMEEV